MNYFKTAQNYSNFSLIRLNYFLPFETDVCVRFVLFSSEHLDISKADYRACKEIKEVLIATQPNPHTQTSYQQVNTHNLETRFFSFHRASARLSQPKTHMHTRLLQQLAHNTSNILYQKQS